MTITAAFDLHDEMLIRYALGLAIQKCISDRKLSEQRKDVVTEYRSEKTEAKFREIERTLHQLEVEELRKIKKKG